MYHRITTLPLSALLLVFAILGCAKEETPATAETLAPEVPSHIQAAVDDALATLEHDYTHPPVSGEVTSRATVYVPAGSTNALAAAIAQAGPGGKVVLKSGSHWETETVMITQMVTITGEKDAILYVDVLPANTTNAAGQFITEAGIWVKNAPAVVIENLDIRPTGADGSMGIFLERGLRARIQNNKFTNFRYPLWLSDLSNMTAIYDNEIVGGGISDWGITVESGKDVKLKGNSSTGTVVGLFLGDERGIAEGNKFNGGAIGILLCTVQGAINLPTGKALQKAVPSNQVKLISNDCKDNIWNYLVIDGAYNNILFRNKASNPGLYDIETAGPTSRFGVPSPTSINNVVINISNDIISKNCGEGNIFLAGKMVNIAEDPCF
jgi:hypothetical protein